MKNSDKCSKDTKTKKKSLTLAEVINDAPTTLGGIQISLKSWIHIVMDNAFV